MHRAYTALFLILYGVCIYRVSFAVWISMEKSGGESEREEVRIKRAFWLDDLIYCTLYIHTTRDCRKIQRYHWSTHFQFTVAHALGFSVFTSRILATVLWQSHCNFISHVKSSSRSLIPFFSLFCSFQFKDSTQLLSNTVLYSLLLCFCLLTVFSYKPSARTPRKTPFSNVNGACLLVCYLSMDVLLLHTYTSRECVYRVVA
jgi:hypothetical protein